MGHAIQVKNILHVKGETVTTVRPETPIRDLAQILADERIGVAVATSVHGVIAGIVSEQDIAKNIARHGPRAIEFRVEDVMVRDVVTCTRVNNLGDILLLMSAQEIRHPPVVEDDRLVGIISMHDVVDCRLGELEKKNETLNQMLSNAAQVFVRVMFMADETHMAESTGEQSADTLADICRQVKDTNINEISLLAIDSLNYFHEFVMLLGIIPDIPECFDEAKSYQPKGYEDHSCDSNFPTRSWPSRPLNIRRTNTGTPSRRRWQASTSWLCCPWPASRPPSPPEAGKKSTACCKPDHKASLLPARVHASVIG